MTLRYSNHLPWNLYSLLSVNNPKPPDLCTLQEYHKHHRYYHLALTAKNEVSLDYQLALSSQKTSI
jgi:hypothetical protein